MEAREFNQGEKPEDIATAAEGSLSEPLMERWSTVRYRIERIGAQLSHIESSLIAFDERAATPVLERLERMQNSFECIMACLAEIEDEFANQANADSAVREAIDAAKHDFVRVAQRYQRSRWSHAKTSH